MTLKPLACALVATSFLAACSVAPVNSKTKVNNEPVVFTEPEVSPPFYALNPFDYGAPPPFEVALKEAAAQPVTKLQVTDPVSGQTTTLETNRLIVPAVNSKQRAVKYAALAGENEVDITDIDDFLQLVEGKARHYPPRFSERQERRGFESKLKEVTQQLDTLAANPDASFDVLIRAFKASIMAKNLDLGKNYTTQSLVYAQRILKINQDDPEANFWFGFALSEGGGHREAIPYLDKAIKLGVQEAYLSAANNYIALEQKKNATTTLNNYKVKYPQETEVANRLIEEIEKRGRWNVWQVLTAPTVQPEAAKTSS